MFKFNSILRITNLILLAVLIVSAFLLVSERYNARILYGRIGKLENEAKVYNLDYSKLQIENAMYSSHLNLQSYALKEAGLIVADKQRVMELKNVSK